MRLSFGSLIFFSYICIEEYCSEMEKLSEYGEQYRRILTYFLKKKRIYEDFVANTKHFNTKVVSKSNFLCGRQYYDDIFNQVVWNNEGLVELFEKFFSFTSAKYPKTIKGYDGTCKESNIFARYNYWISLLEEWQNFIYRREYEEITILK